MEQEGSEMTDLLNHPGLGLVLVNSQPFRAYPAFYHLLCKTGYYIWTCSKTPSSEIRHVKILRALLPSEGR